jgi:heterotetrameric sarcosine oxidase gamma subunit
MGAVLCSSAGPGADVARALEAALGCPVPVAHGAVAEGPGRRVLWLSPKAWIVLCAPEDEDDLVETVAAAFPDHAVLASRYTDALCWLTLDGADAESALRQGSFLRFRAVGLPPGQAKRTLVAGIPAVILREADGAWTVGVERSRGRYFSAWLTGLTHSFGDAE